MLDKVVAPSREKAMADNTQPDTAAGAVRRRERPGLAIKRHFTREGVDPFAEVEWELRDAVIAGADGKVFFEQKQVEFPTAWSQTATNVVVQKYFRGTLGTPERERSVKQMIGRVADTIYKWGREGGYFKADKDAWSFRDELVHLLVQQKMAFNSPVWFNVGVEQHPQCSACFINSVDDSMASILTLAKTEGMLFKYGSGTGSNLSTLRSSAENLHGGGTASGPVSFMRGFDAFAGAIKSGGKTRRAAKMVILDADHPDVVDFIECKAREEQKAWALIDAGYDGGFNVPGGAYDSVNYQNANHSVRVTDEFMRAVLAGGTWSTHAVVDGRVIQTYQARDLMRKIAEAAHLCGDPGMQFDTTINDWHPCISTARINASNPCSEYMFLDDSACNLASLNLRKFQHENGDFDVEAYERAIEITILAMEIIVDNSSYPTEKITENSHRFRPLGLGYANLGALLMSRGLPYDSEPGRAYAAALTAILCGHAYRTSARIAAEATGPFEGYPENRDPFLRVMRKHRDAVDDIDAALVPYDLMEAARSSWDDAIALGEIHGFRNGQTTVLAPTGTIAFLMDCDTTGVEPDIALVKYKRLVGGGMLKMVNQTVPEALRRLGHREDQVEAIVKYVNAQETIEGAPGLKDEHLPVFDCAFRSSHGTRSIHYMGHIRMMAAVQPFLSGAISKTVNLPSDCTIEDIEDAYIQAWNMGLKAIAVYRDGCKRTQPLSTNKEQATSNGAQKLKATLQDEDVLELLDPEERRMVEDLRARRNRPAGPPAAVRYKLPPERSSFTHKFSVGGHEGYVTVGLYEDGQPGEIFVRMAKEGSVIAGLMDSFATAVSLALQHGVPLSVLCEKMKGTRFEPSGFTGNPEIPIATSIMDYLFRWLSMRFLGGDKHPAAKAQGVGQLDLPAIPLTPEEGNRPQSGSVTPASRMSASPRVTARATIVVEKPEAMHSTWVRETDAPPCHECGTLMVRNGACYKCANCGATSGCS
jgi:ribonucleoside-diphosphate reductase alpha chain